MSCGYVIFYCNLRCNVLSLKSMFTYVDSHELLITSENEIDIHSGWNMELQNFRGSVWKILQQNEQQFLTFIDTGCSLIVSL